jgi:hypothetical protein
MYQSICPILTKYRISRRFFVEVLTAELHKNPPSFAPLWYIMAVGRTYMAQVTGAFGELRERF